MIKKSAYAVALVSLVASLCNVPPLQAADKNAKVDNKSKPTATKTVADDKSKVTLVYEHELPHVPGKSLKGVLVEYAPGGSTPSHTHAKSAFIYATVLEGSINSQVNNGPVKTYKVGENFSEMPGDVHGVSENASKTKPARLLAVFVVDTNEKQLTTIRK